MNSFADLESLHRHLEDKALDYKHPQLIGSLFRKVRDAKHEEKKPEEAEKAQWEFDLFNVVLRDGEVAGVPSLDISDDRALEYLIRRLKDTKNPVLKARYSHILWCSPKKHAKYAEMAVDSYLELIKFYEEKDLEKPDEHFGFDLLHVAENAYSIAVKIGYKVEVIKSEFRRLVTQFNLNSSSSPALRADLIRLMLKEKKKFSTEDLRGFENICWQISQSLTKEGNIYAAIQMLTLGEEVDQRLDQKTREWRKLIAEAHEMIMNRNLKANKPVALEHCLLAITDYKRIKCEEKIKELENKYTELKSSLEFGVFRTEIDLTDQIKRYRQVAQRIVENDAAEIIKFLMLDKNILPKYKDVQRIAQEHAAQFIMQHIAPIQIMDQSGHPAQHFSDDEEKKCYGILQQYKWALELDKIHLIKEIFFAAIRENKLSSDIMFEFLSKHSWLGRNIPKEFPNNEIIEYKWLDIIAPALCQYFLQMQDYLLNYTTNYPNLVLSIDSLTLKVEGLLRDICQFRGITSFYITQDSKGRSISREKGIHALLYEEPVKQLFDEDDLLFFKFLLVEKAGYNLRHRIAHSLMLSQEYSIELMHLLILALLRLGKYDFVQKADQV